MHPSIDNIAAETRVERAQARRRRWLLVTVLIFVLAGTASIAVLGRARPLTPREELLIGRWYTTMSEHDVGYRYVAIEEYREDKKVWCHMRAFERPDEQHPWVSASGPESSEFSWAIEGDEIEIVERTSSPHTWRERLEILISERRWLPLHAELVRMKIVELQPDRKTYDAGVIFGTHVVLESVRVGDDFRLPDQPLSIDEVLAGKVQNLEPDSPGNQPRE